MTTPGQHADDDQNNVLDDLLRAVLLAADTAAIDGRVAGKTNAAITHDAVRAALECAIGNGLIDVVPQERWPEFVMVDPPYKLPA